ncbi:GNAT family N-acetyltransferase [Dermacoccaceae bacterium W4C1]
MHPDPWPRTVDGLVLRRPDPADVEAMLAFRNLPEANRFMMNTHSDPHRFRNAFLADDRGGDHSCAAVLDGRVVAIGFLEIVDGSGQPGMPRGTEGLIGYIVDPQHWRQGIAARLALGLLDAGFVDLGLRRITAGCNADNIGSVRALEKAGMRREKHGIADSWHAELGWVDDYEYALLAHEWDPLPR